VGGLFKLKEHMTYNPPTLRLPHTPNNFGGLVNDGSRNAMTGALGNQILSQDAAGSPVASPATVNTTQTLAVPNNAVSITIVSVTNAVQVSEDSTQTAFFSLPAGVPWEFDCARMSSIFLKTGSSTVVSFFFKLV